MGSTQKPSSRPYSGALSGMRPNAQMGPPACVDRSRTTIARSEMAQWFSCGVLEYIGPRWRKYAGARLSVIDALSERSLKRPDVVRSEQSLAVTIVPTATQTSRPPLEIAGEIGNYIKLDTDFSLFSHVARA